MADAWDGRPQNPERDGWHWLADDIGQRIAARWKANPYQTWSLRAFLSPSDVIGLGWSYLGPALLPAEVAAREAAAAAEAGRLRDIISEAVRCISDGCEDEADRLLRAALAGEGRGDG